MTTFSTSVPHNIGSTSKSNQTRERNKKHISQKEEQVKLSLFADDIIPYVENPKDSTKTDKLIQ